MISQIEAAMQSATGNLIPDSFEISLSGSRQKPKQPVRFRVIAYGEQTTQPYDGSDRAAAQRAWDGVEHGIFLGVDEDHAWAAIDRR